MLKPPYYTGFECPNPDFKKIIHIENLRREEWTVTERGMEIQCPHCRQPFNTGPDSEYRPME